MKKYIKLLILLIIPINIYALDINSDNYIMYNLNDNQIVMEKDAKEQIYVASLTKITTAIVAIENIENLNAKVTIPSEGLEGLIEANATTAGFKLGQSVTYKDLLYGLMLPSGADAAQTLAYLIGGSNEGFVELMNEFANKLELETTHFTNTTGLHNDDNYSSVYDVSKILLYALENDNFKEIFTASTYLISDKSITLKNSYLSIIDRYELTNNYITGAKTGFTDEAGYCLASTGIYEDFNYLLITAGGDYEQKIPNHLIDSLNIYDYVASNYDYIDIYKKGDILKYITAENSTKSQYNILAPEDFSYYTDKNINTESFTYIYEGIDIITPSYNKEIIGEIKVNYQGYEVHSFDALYDDSLEYSLSGLVSVYWEYILGGSLFVVLLLIGLLKRKKRR